MASISFQRAYNQGALPGQDTSAREFLASRGTPEANLKYVLGRTFGQGISQVPRLTNTETSHPLGSLLEFGLSSPLRAGLMAALAGGALGVAGGYATDRNPWTTGAMGAGLAGLGAGWLSNHAAGLKAQREQQWNSQPQVKYSRVKRAAPWRWPTDHTSPDLVSSALLPSIAQRVMLDTRMPTEVQLVVNNYLPRLNSDQLTSLDSLLRTSFSAGAGALTAKYLFKAGVGGTVLGGLIGAYLGRPNSPYGTRDTSYWQP
jgi:hypothetical protein